MGSRGDENKSFYLFYFFIYIYIIILLFLFNLICLIIFKAIVWIIVRISEDYSYIIIEDSIVNFPTDQPQPKIQKKKQAVISVLL